MTTGSAALALIGDDDAQRRQHGLDESLVQFIQANETRIKWFLQRICDDSGLVEDAFQEALIVARAKWEVVSRHVQPLFWVRKTAWYKLLTLLDSGRDVGGLAEIEPEPIGDPSAQWEAEQMLRQLLSRLPARQRAALALAMDGCDDMEIAHQLGLALTTVRSYKVTARRKLKELTEEAGREAAARSRT